jgi:ElaB/YqjD/DUF883 family membrane-anchored ribosome-binding protein
VGEGDKGATQPTGDELILAKDQSVVIAERSDRYMEQAEKWADMAQGEEQLSEQTHALRRAIDADKLQIEEGLALLQQEFDRYSTPVKEAIETTRERVEVVKGNVRRVKEFDWQHWVKENPWKAVGIGFAAGFYVGSMLSD